MNNKFRETWEIYGQAWKSETDDEKLALFEQALEQNCVYTDPLTVAKGWEQLLEYMKEFHQQTPGGHFETTYFLAHHNKSMTQWNMKNADEVVIGTGISYGQYSDQGKLVAMTGFFEVPDNE